MKAEYIEHMGSDLRVANSARVSFNKESSWEWDHAQGESNPSKTLSERDQKLISYLARHNHWSPFSHVMITMRETVPIFVARQRFKHMVGFAYNEVSRRYVSDEPAFFVPDSWREASENKKQGSSDVELTTLISDERVVWDDPLSPFIETDIKEEYEHFISYAKELYQRMIKSNASPEQARMILPQSMYTSYYVTGSLAAWARAYSLRIKEDSQKEIQDLASQWNTIISSIEELKYSWSALTKQ